MVKLLGKALRKQQKQDADGAQETAAPVEEQPRDRILVLVPGEGGFAFRLLAFPSIEHAAAYGLEHYPQRMHQLYSFRPHHQRPPDPSPGAPGQIEAIVMVRDEDRHGTVHLYSFVDMETALAFVRAEGMRGLNLPLVLVYWAEPVALYKDAASEANHAMPELTGPPPPVLTQWQQPKSPMRNPVFDSLTSEPDARPTFADEVRDSAFDPPFPPNTGAAPPPSANLVPAIETPPPPPQPAPQASTPPAAPPPAPPQAAPAPVSPNGGSFTTQKKEPRRWNASEDFAPSAPAARPDATPARPESDEGGRVGGIINRIRSWPGWDGFGPVIAGAAMLRWQTYDEARKDPYAQGRALVLVGASISASALAAVFAGPFAFFTAALFGAIGAAVYAGCILLIGTQIVGARPERDDTRLFLRRLGLAAAPGPLLVLGIIPIYGPMFTLGVLIWVMLTSIKATEIGLEMERQYAAFTAIISWLALFAIAVVIPSVAS